MPYFVIQEHRKRKIRHYDLMLEKNGALLTWSVDDILPLRKAGSILPAVKLSPHRLAYLTYEGKISRGRGIVKIYDKGSYSSIGNSKPFLVNLKGKILKGCYCLLPACPDERRGVGRCDNSCLAGRRAGGWWIMKA